MESYSMNLDNKLFALCEKTAKKKSKQRKSKPTQILITFI